MIEAALSMAKVQFAHNRWANEHLLSFLKSLPAEQYAQTPCSGNGPIGATVAHLILVQKSWLTWLKGDKSLADAIAIVRQSASLEDAAAAHKEWTAVDDLTNAYLDDLTDEAFVTERSFSLPGAPAPSSLPLWEMLLQLTSHGVHTRAQVISAIRSTGVKPPEVSFLRFCLETRQASVAPEETDDEISAEEELED